MRRWLLLLLLFGLCFTTFNAHAQDDNTIPSNDPPYPCPYNNGAYYQPNLFPRYDIGSKSLVLVDMTTGETVRVLDTLSERNIRLINWSPDCRYLSGAVGTINRADEGMSKWGSWSYYSWLGYSIVLWDAIDGGRIHSFASIGGRYVENGQLPVIWSPDANNALVLNGCYSSGAESWCTDDARSQGDVLWNRATNNDVPLHYSSPDGYQEHTVYFNQVYWDTANGTVWGSGKGGVAVFNVSDGSEVIFWNNCHQKRCGAPEARFTFSPDHTKLIVYSIARTERHPYTITVYDIATMTGTEVNVEGLAAPYIPFADYHPVALSPDNRYLVVGYDALRVWDLQNLPEKVEDRLPVYRHGGPKARIWSVRFAAPEVIETTSEEGTQRWDLHTGAYIP